MRFRAAALIVLRFGGLAAGAEDAPLGDFLFAQAAFMACERRFLAAALIFLRLGGADAPFGGLPGPRRPPSRAAMAALRRSRSAFSSVIMLSRVKWGSSQPWLLRLASSVASRSKHSTCRPVLLG
jgi:hypothetical protein